MTTETSPAKPALEPRALLQKLQEQSPTFRECKPLAIRIDTNILERFPEFEKKTLRTALRMHTASTRYLKSMEKATERFDFEGNVAGEVTEEQRAHASATLKDRFAAAAKQQRAKREAEEAERKREEADRRREEKLQQLMSKFGK